MRKPRPTKPVIDKLVLDLIKGQPAGNDPKARPKQVDSYQLAIEFETEHPVMAEPLLEFGFGGLNGSKGNGGTLTQEMQWSCQRLKRQGLIRVRYASNRHVRYVRKNGDIIVPSADVRGIYELRGARVENDDAGWTEEGA